MEFTALKTTLLRLVAALALVSAGSLSSIAAAPTAEGDSALVAVTGFDDFDSDGDGLLDDVETALGTDPQDPDSDLDGMPDGWETWNALDPLSPADAFGDADGDGIANLDEYEWGLLPFERDSDGDGFWDSLELARGADGASASSFPKSSVPCDIDQDGLVNAVDVQMVINAALGMATPAPANVNAVGDVNAVDVQMVIRSALQLDS